ncbi:MAG: class I SAM-dependent methyltransferase [Candidatus Thorarchaeota archaeon]|jgi:SAM-dependent methyltransferase
MAGKMDVKTHWEEIYNTKSPTEVSWYQKFPFLSLQLIKSTGVEKMQGIIDVGGGASLLVDSLLDEGYEDLAVLDISSRSLDVSKARLGERCDNVQWFIEDVRAFQRNERFHLWHDRAVFHFLTDEKDQRKYIDNLKRSLVPKGYAIIATFAIDGPTRCSGLDVVRYNGETICGKLGPSFEQIGEYDESHFTPGGNEQKFTYFLFKRK